MKTFAGARTSGTSTGENTFIGVRTSGSSTGENTFIGVRTSGSSTARIRTSGSSTGVNMNQWDLYRCEYEPVGSLRVWIWTSGTSTGENMNQLVLYRWESTDFCFTPPPWSYKSFSIFHTLIKATKYSSILKF